MSDLIVITFDSESEAKQALDTIRSTQKGGGLKLTDTAVITKDADGKVDVKNEWSSGAEAGAVAGGIIGLMTSFILPVVGTVAGAAVGGWIGSKLTGSVDGDFVKDVSAQLEPGKSALFLLMGSGDPAAVRASLEAYQGKVLQTTLSQDFEDSLNQALRHRS